jgi:sirohydrochlorin cobaltochelatase
MAQESHHHHVEGVGGGLEDCPCKGDCDASCRDKAFCEQHGLPWTPVHAHTHDDDHEHNHDHSHDHGDDHHHHPYPHADHPLGPVTLPEVQGTLARIAKQETGK